MRLILSKKHQSWGFTLIELLLVMSIISLLSSIILATLSVAREKARDSSRKQTLVQLRNALELYYSTNGVYPTTGGVYFTSYPGGEGGRSNNSGDWIPSLVTAKTISVLPQDLLATKVSTNPSGSCAGLHYSYLYRSNGTSYKLLSFCAPEGTMSATDAFYDPVRPTWAWMVVSSSVLPPGGDCTGFGSNPNYPICW